MTPRSSDPAFPAVADLLAHIHPKTEPPVIEESLRERFGSGSAMFAASPHLLESSGLSETDALLIGSMNELSRYSARTDHAGLPLLNTLPAAARYLADSMRTLSEERFCLLCLDVHGKLKADVILQNGTDDTALFSLKALLAEVIRTNPSAIILSHNHPRRTLHPSREDIACTREALRALSVLGIPMLDHIIIAGRRAVSIRDNGFIPAELWLNQAPDSKLLRLWLQ